MFSLSVSKLKPLMDRIKRTDWLIDRVVFTISEDLVMARKIKPQRAQRIERELLFLSFAPSMFSVTFRNLISKIPKSLRGFGHYSAMVHKDP